MKSFLLKTILPFLVIVAIAVVLDQLSKIWIENNLNVGEVGFEFWFIRIRYIRNDGIAWGLFSEYGDILNWVIPVVVILLTAYFLYFSKRQNGGFITVLAFGLIIGGALGNLIDRFRQGFVTDFISPRFFATFNFADAYISVGLVLVVLALFLAGRASDKPTPPIDEPPPQNP